MNNLRKLLTSHLTNAYYREAPDDISYDYTTFTIKEVPLYFNRKDYYVTLKVFYENEVDLINKCDEYIELFDFKTINEDEMSYTFYLERNEEVEETDKRINIRYMRFHVQGYDERKAK